MNIPRFLKPFIAVSLLATCLYVSSYAAPKKKATRPAPKVLSTNVLTVPAKNGAIRITPIIHGSLQIEYKDLVIHLDPFSQGNYSRAKKANIILITHTHPDHLDKEAIIKVVDGVAETFVPEAASDAVIDINWSDTIDGVLNDISLKNGETYSGQFEGAVEGRLYPLTITVVPAYNLKRGPKPGQKFHPKGVGNGYVLDLAGKRIYIAGDTEFVPEMKNLKNIDVAFLPMNLPYTMTPQEAAQAARSFKPKIAVPYHYRYPFNKPNNNPQQFAAALKGSGIQVKLLKWYPNE